MAVATRSVNLELQPSKIQVWRGSCQDLIPAELQDKVRLTLSCLGGTSKFTATLNPAMSQWARQASVEKNNTTLSENCTLAELNAERTQCAVSERRTRHVCWCSKSACSAHEFCARTRSSQLRQTGHDLLVPPHSTRHHLSISLFTSQTWRTWSGLCSPATRSSPMVRLAVDHSHAWMATTQSPDTDTLFNAAPRLRAQLAQLQNEQARLPSETTWRSPSPKKHTEETSLHQPKKPPQANF